MQKGQSARALVVVPAPLAPAIPTRHLDRVFPRRAAPGQPSAGRQCTRSLNADWPLGISCAVSDTMTLRCVLLGQKAAVPELNRNRIRPSSCWTRTSCTPVSRNPHLNRSSAICDRAKWSVQEMKPVLSVSLILATQNSGFLRSLRRVSRSTELGDFYDFVWKVQRERRPIGS